MAYFYPALRLLIKILDALTQWLIGTNNKLKLKAMSDKKRQAIIKKKMLDLLNEIREEECEKGS